jgi:hypothetical protein
MTLILDTMQNVYVTAQSHINPAMSIRVLANVATTVDTSDKYDPVTAAAILAAQGGPDANAPTGKKEFLAWLNA